MIEPDRLFIVPGTKGKTHLAYMKREYTTFGREEMYWICFNQPQEVYRGSPCDYSTDWANREDAEYFDQFYNEVNCPTCLKWALGKPVNPQLCLVEGK